MLIRIFGHYIDNPSHIDKLISIKGLPEGWFFRPVKKKIGDEIFEGKELITPWLPEIEANVPESIRHLCEKHEIIKIFPPISKGESPVVDRLTIIGVRFDYMSNPGQELWEKIERYLDRMTPRDQKVPKPVMVAPDHKSMFNPHEARRSARGSLELRPTEIPSVDLRIIPSETSTVALAPTASIVVQQVPTPRAPEPKAERQSFVCQSPDCGKVFDKKQALLMHQRKKHPAKEPAGV